MSTEEPNFEAGDSPETKGEKPWPVIIMLAMVFSVIVVGFLLVPKTEEQKLWWLSVLGTNNYGVLMNPPLDLSGQLLDSEGNIWSADHDTPWKLVLVNQGPCTQECQDMADLAARVHARLNRESTELKRGYLSFGPDSSIGPNQALGFEQLQAPAFDLQARLSESGVPALAEGPLVFVMNPLEVFFLYYTTEHEGIGMLEDIEHVIKLAQ
jgi:hypothetical protein